VLSALRRGRGRGLYRALGMVGGLGEVLLRGGGGLMLCGAGGPSLGVVFSSFSYSLGWWGGEEAVGVWL